MNHDDDLPGALRHVADGRHDGAAGFGDMDGLHRGLLSGRKTHSIKKRRSARGGLPAIRLGRVGMVVGILRIPGASAPGARRDAQGEENRSQREVNTAHRGVFLHQIHNGRPVKAAGGKAIQKDGTTVGVWLMVRSCSNSIPNTFYSTSVI